MTWPAACDPPTAGPLASTWTWPDAGVPESRVEVDGGAILEAANAAVTF
jgi:hypothetical protein